VTASGPQQAQLWRPALEGQGIRCRVVGGCLGTFGVVSPGHPGPELWVCRQDAERAQAVLEHSATVAGKGLTAERRKLLLRLAAAALEDDAPLPGADAEYETAKQAQAALVRREGR
jgi:hypothetical protein